LAVAVDPINDVKDFERELMRHACCNSAEPRPQGYNCLLRHIQHLSANTMFVVAQVGRTATEPTP